MLPRLPVIVHHGDDDGDALYVFIGDVKHQRLVVGGVQRVLLDGRLPLFEPPSITDQRRLHVRVCGERGGRTEGRQGGEGDPQSCEGGAGCRCSNKPVIRLYRRSFQVKLDFSVFLLQM